MRDEFSFELMGRNFIIISIHLLKSIWSGLTFLWFQNYSSMHVDCGKVRYHQNITSHSTYNTINISVHRKQKRQERGALMRITVHQAITGAHFSHHLSQRTCCCFAIELYQCSTHFAGHFVHLLISHNQAGVP